MKPVDNLFALARLTYALLWGVERSDKASLSYSEGRIVLRIPKRRLELSRGEIDELIAALVRARSMVGRTDLKMGAAAATPRGRRR